MKPLRGMLATALVFGFAAALVLLALIAASSYRGIVKAREDRDWVEHTHQVISEVEELLSQVKDAETGERGYLLAGEPRYLEPYRSASAAIPQLVKTLRKLTADNSGQQRRIDRLDALIKERYALLDRAIELRTDGQRPEVAESTERADAGKRLMDAVRSVITDMKVEEHGLLLDRSLEAAASEKSATVIIIAGNAVSFVMLIAGIVLLRRESTRREQAQLVAERHADEIEALYNGAPCGYHSVNADGLMISVNDTELAWLGYAREDVVGKMHHWNLMTATSADDFRGEIFPLFKRQGALNDVEISYLRKDGSVLLASLNSTAVYDAAGNYLMSRSTIYDITERRRAEFALRESEERFRLMVGSVVDYAILMLDPQGRVTSWNSGAEQIKGYCAEEIIGRSFTCFYTQADIERGLPEAALRAAAADGRFECEGWRVRKDGTAFWADVVIGAVRDAGGALRGFSKVTRDLTQRKQAAEENQRLTADLERRGAQLELTNKELESFSYSVSHDLRSPLRAVDGYSQMLEEDYAGKLDAEGLRLLAVIRDSSQKMGILIDDLLRFSKLGRKPIAAAGVDMNALVREGLREIPLNGGPTHPQISIGELPGAWGDRALLKQVWINLLANAIKFAGKRETPCVEVAGRTDGAELVYSVRDNGVGFDMRYYLKLFGVFQRLHGNEQFPGTGVGLAIVQRVVTRHGGRVWAEGEPDHGATFYFALPTGESNG